MMIKDILKRKIILAIILMSIILINIPTKVLAWMPYYTYDACNPINIWISRGLIAIAIIIIYIYIMWVLIYGRKSQDEKNTKNKKIIKWLIIVLIQIAILILAAIGIKEIGMEWYWSHTGERFQINEVDGYISSAIRMVALIVIVAYIISSAIYFFKSKKEENVKLIELAKWQMITITIVTSLLLLATNW